MAQIKFTADITAAQFPLLADWAGRTVLQPQSLEGQPPIIKPQIIYCQDILPTAQGYKSVSYQDLLAAASPANVTFSKIFTVSDTSQNKALIGITTNSKIYMITPSNFIWTDVTPALWGGGDAVTTGTASGIHYLYLKLFGCYVVNIVAGTLTVQALTGITAGNIHGITSAMNYLLLWDATKIYWNATDGSLNFVPSLITGAGSSTPFDIEGTIVVALQLQNGFVVYTDTNIILASFSNNTQYPWIFRAASNGSGVTHSKQVAYSRDSSYHIAITFAGVLQVSAQGCVGMTPEVADFIAARLYESYDFGTDSVVSQNLSDNLLTQITLLASRFIVLSYGITSYTDAIVYDLQLKRWGRLHINHAACFELEVDVSGGVGKPYNEATELGATYAAASPQPYNEAAGRFNRPPDIGYIFGFLQVDGAVKIALLDYANTSATAVLLLGKYQASRSSLLELAEIAVESIPTTNLGLTVRVLSSLHGKDITSIITPTPLLTDNNLRTYGMRCVAKNHTIAFLGSFNLTAVEITATLSARR